MTLLASFTRGLRRGRSDPDDYVIRLASGTEHAMKIAGRCAELSRAPRGLAQADAETRPRTSCAVCRAQVDGATALRCERAPAAAAVRGMGERGLRRTVGGRRRRTRGARGIAQRHAQRRRPHGLVMRGGVVSHVAIPGPQPALVGGGEGMARGYLLHGVVHSLR